MPRPPAPRLSPREAAHARTIGAAIRAGRVAGFVGAGLSIDAGLPSWSTLGARLIQAWQAWDPTPGVRRLGPENYVRLIRHLFDDNDLAFVSYLRRALRGRVAGRQPPPFSTLLYQALYSDPHQSDTFLYPTPTDVHRHLVALFAAQPKHLWTLNYDDLLERAAEDLGLRYQTLDLAQHRVQEGLLVTHLHGFLSPRRPDEPVAEAATEAAVVLAEDDYHAVAANQVAWINHEFYRLFEEHAVLILGMSLTDANLRRVLATLPPVAHGTKPVHYATLPPLSAPGLPLKGIRSTTRDRLTADAMRMRADYWAGYGLGIVDLTGYASYLPFVVRLRYESAGDAAGDLWRWGAEQGYAAIKPWAEARQAHARQALGRVWERLHRQFDVPAGEVVDLGLFLVHPEHLVLELVARVGASPAPQPGGRAFSINPDAPTGAAGYVFTTGSGFMVSRGHAVHDFGAAPVDASTGAAATYAGIILSPVIDWTAGGVPLGVIYVTVASLAGHLFAGDQAGVIDWLGEAGQAVLGALRERPGGLA